MECVLARAGGFGHTAVDPFRQWMPITVMLCHISILFVPTKCLLSAHFHECVAETFLSCSPKNPNVCVCVCSDRRKRFHENLCSHPINFIFPVIIGDLLFSYFKEATSKWTRQPKHALIHCWWFLTIQEKIMEIVNIQRTSYGEVAEHRMNEFDRGSCRDRARRKSVVWHDLTAIGTVLMHYIVEIIVLWSPNALRRIMISPRRLFEYISAESRKANWMHDHREANNKVWDAKAVMVTNPHLKGKNLRKIRSWILFFFLNCFLITLIIH